MALDLSFLGGIPEGLLTAEQQTAAQDRARQAAALQLGLGMIAGAQGQRGAGKPGLAQIVGQAGPGALQAYQSSFDQTLKNALTSMQLQEMRRKQAEQAQLQNLTAQMLQVQRGPETREMIASEQGDDYLTRPGQVTGVGINRQMLPALFAVPGGPARATELLNLEQQMAGKTEVVEIYNDKGQPMKVRYNQTTGEYTPLGGAKAEPFVQVDRGNVIELRRPSGEVIGTLSKGAAPTAPSFTMTDYGVLNTKTGQVFQPKDEKGNPVVIDQSAKATEGERLSSGFYMRMADASNIFSKPLTDANGKPIVKDGKIITIQDVGSKPEIFAEIVGGLIPNWAGGRALQNFATSTVRQQYEQAQENWVTANLRKESGAVIGPEEMQNEIKKWFPQVGDSQEKIEQKRKSRIVAEESMRRNAGRALTTTSQSRNITVDY